MPSLSIQSTTCGRLPRGLRPRALDAPVTPALSAGRNGAKSDIAMNFPIPFPMPSLPRAAARKYFYPTEREAFQRWKRLFPERRRSTILAQWPNFANVAHRQLPNSLKPCSAILGRLWAGRKNMTLQPGSLQTTGHHKCQSPRPKSSYSSNGSAISSMNFSGKVDEIKRRHKL